MAKVNNQRQTKKGTSKGKISVGQIRRLEELGVWWDTHPVGICPGYLSIPKKILLPTPAVFSHIRETIGTRVAAWGARSGM